MRLDKFLANLKYGSRSEVKNYIKQGIITVNDKVITQPKTHIDPNKDIVYIDNEKVFYKDRIILMMNKPSGVVSATKDHVHKTVIDFIKEPYNRFDLSIVGRLDKDTEGLILLSNDGTFVHNMIHPKKDVMKKYYVEVNKPFDCSKLTKDYEILDGNNRAFTPKECIVKPIDETRFYLLISEGKFHQVKRMVAHFSREVIYLKRVAIGDIVLDETLSLGGYKEIEV